MSLRRRHLLSWGQLSTLGTVRQCNAMGVGRRQDSPRVSECLPCWCWGCVRASHYPQGVSTERDKLNFSVQGESCRRHCGRTWFWRMSRSWSERERRELEGTSLSACHWTSANSYSHLRQCPKRTSVSKLIDWERRVWNDRWFRAPLRDRMGWLNVRVPTFWVWSPKSPIVVRRQPLRKVHTLSRPYYRWSERGAALWGSWGVFP